ncbi:carboxymuconolactone decarboxylase family protein [Truepera radiovictrix]|jgi:4-carboxymuconolactone decarboxylase|uniref:Carboxymuconolactone decarboxylase n=1 Tax=Truepera radiovictrix (strain DSM 17093 / CIP 108686 / LMG 22925 / RQ-24) TaxID=649638 RepID=D7CUE5_TRURR|nr:Carboxymuconolactone decarboxylase [Truepera radiovictrix DSM 17093]
MTGADRGDQPGAASVRQRLWGAQRAAIEGALHTLDPDLAALITDVVYETVLARPGLDLKTRELLAVTALIGVGGERELKTHLRGALRCGATVGELKEVIIQAAMFVGFPKALAAMRALRGLEPPPAPDAAEVG